MDARMLFGCLAACSALQGNAQDMRIRWVHPDLGLVDIEDDAGLPETIRLFAGGRVILEVLTQGASSVRLMHEQLVTPETRANVKVVAGDQTHALAPAEGRYPPAWSMGAVWYQVFPDRFWRAGETLHDELHTPWNSAWLDVSLEELEQSRAAGMAENRRSWAESTPLSQVISRRRYGGNLPGLVERLDHIADLGATGVYLNPIFDARSTHRYDAADHRHVDPRLANRRRESLPDADAPATWTWTPADRYFVDTVIPAAHAHALRLIIDGVWNHVGQDHWAFADVRQHGRGSPYADWFDARFNANGDLIGWSGWDRTNGALPEFRQTPDGDLIAPAKAHVEHVTRRWMDPNADGDASDGIDGWRLDVVPDIGLPFWRDWNSLVRSINSDAVTIAEVWHRADEHLQGDTFDAQMNYPVRRALLPWLGHADRFTSEKVVEMLEESLALGDRVNLAQMNLLGSHDTTRAVSQIAEHKGEPEGRPSRASYELLIVGVALQVAMPGAPSVYYGDEWGVYGGNDPHNRKPAPWPDAGPYDDASAPLPWVRDEMATWLRLRQDPALGDVLRYGSWRLFGEEEWLAVKRTLNGRTMVIVANRADEPVAAPPLVAELHPFRGASPTLPARSAAIWTSE